MAGDAPFADTDALVGDLRSAVGGDHVLVGSPATDLYDTDWTGRRLGRSRAVVRPASTAELADALATCSRHGAAVVVQGGNTGLVGGGVPVGGEVVLSTARLRTVGPVDEQGRRVVVGAGAVLQQVQASVRPLGLDVGVDFAARGSATIGGMVATNAGGEQVLRYGSMRAQVAGLEVVLADGSVVDRLGALPKDATGYDLSGLLCGSEGTLGVVTRVDLRLVERVTESAVAVVGVGTVAAAVDVLSSLRARLPALIAAELVLPAGLDLVLAYTGLPAPLGVGCGAYLVVETGGPEATDVLVAALAAVDGVLDAIVETGESGRARLWRYREAHTEALAASRPLKLDVAVPVRDLARFVDELPAVVAGAGAPATARVVAFGHVAEGNLHVNVVGLGGAGDVGSTGAAEDAVTEAVLRRVASLGGTISSEHGVGRAKRRWLGLTRSAADVAAMRAIKRALDPGGLLGPGVLFGDD